MGILRAIHDFAKDTTMKRLLLPFIALAVFTAALAGCGQKGPLFLPVPPIAPPLVVRQPSPSPTPAAVMAPTAPSSATR